MAAPWSDDSSTRRSELPSVWPKPRSSGSATTVATLREASLKTMSSFFGLMSSCQFFWITGLAFSFGGCDLCALNTEGRSRGSDAATLARAAAVVRNWRHVANRGDVEAGRLDRPQRRFAARTRARDLDFQRAHAMFGGLPHRVLGRHLRRERGRLARALEAHGAGGRPGDRVALRVGNRDHRVVERRVHVGDA